MTGQSVHWEGRNQCKVARGFSQLFFDKSLTTQMSTALVAYPIYANILDFWPEERNSL